MSFITSKSHRTEFLVYDQYRVNHKLTGIDEYRFRIDELLADCLPRREKAIDSVQIKYRFMQADVDPATQKSIHDKGSQLGSGTFLEMMHGRHHFKVGRATQVRQTARHEIARYIDAALRYEC